MPFVCLLMFAFSWSLKSFWSPETIAFINRQTNQKRFRFFSFEEFLNQGSVSQSDPYEQEALAYIQLTTLGRQALKGQKYQKEKMNLIGEDGSSFEVVSYLPGNFSNQGKVFIIFGGLFASEKAYPLAIQSLLETGSQVIVVPNFYPNALDTISCEHLGNPALEAFFIENTLQFHESRVFPIKPQEIYLVGASYGGLILEYWTYSTSLFQKARVKEFYLSKPYNIEDSLSRIDFLMDKTIAPGNLYELGISRFFKTNFRASYEKLNSKCSLPSKNFSGALNLFHDLNRNRNALPPKRAHSSSHYFVYSSNDFINPDLAKNPLSFFSGEFSFSYPLIIVEGGGHLAYAVLQKSFWEGLGKEALKP